MATKVFKSTTSARTIQYQDSLLATAVPGWPDVSTYLDDERNNMFRPSQRQTKDELYVASAALLGETETEAVAIFGAARLRGAVIHCVEEGITLDKKTKLPEFKRIWKSARRAGAAMRGARISDETKKAKTAERFAIIADRWPLPSKDWPAKVLLKESGIRSINTVNNLHLKVDKDGKLITKTREDFQAEYQARLKRKERNAKR